MSCMRTPAVVGLGKTILPRCHWRCPAAPRMPAQRLRSLRCFICRHEPCHLAPTERPAWPARFAAAGQHAAGQAAAHPPGRRSLGGRIRPALSHAAGPSTATGDRRPRTARRGDARPAGGLPAQPADQPDRRRDGPATGAVRLGRRGLAQAAPHGHGQLRARSCARLLSVAGQGHAAAAFALAQGGASGAGHPAAGRPDALHRRRHRRPGLRQGHQHPRIGRGRDPAPPGQGAAGDLQARAEPRAVLALVQAGIRPGARAQRGGDQPHHPRVHRPGAAAAARRTRAARPAAQPARSDDRRCRPARQRPGRPPCRRQRADHAAGRRGHHRQHAGLDDPPAAAQPAALQRVQQEVRTLAPDPAAYRFDQMEQLVYPGSLRQRNHAPEAGGALHRAAGAARHHRRRRGRAAGTQIWGVLRHDSVSEQHFARPEAFEPERWLDVDACRP